MAEVERLHDALIDELKDLLNAEKQLTKALPKMAKNATNPKLRQAIRSHLTETKTQVRRLEQALRALDEKVEGKLCDGMQGIIKEGNKMIEEAAERRGPRCLHHRRRTARRALRDRRLWHLHRVGESDGTPRSGAAVDANAERREGRRQEADGDR